MLGTKKELEVWFGSYIPIDDSCRYRRDRWKELGGTKRSRRREGMEKTEHSAEQINFVVILLCLILSYLLGNHFYTLKASYKYNILHTTGSQTVSGKVWSPNFSGWFLWTLNSGCSTDPSYKSTIGEELRMTFPHPGAQCGSKDRTGNIQRCAARPQPLPSARNMVDDQTLPDGLVALWDDMAMCGTDLWPRIFSGSWPEHPLWLDN